MAFFKEIFIILLIAVVFIIGFSAYVCFIYIRPRQFISAVTPKEFNLVPFDNVELKTDDGLTLKGWYIHSETPIDNAVIICHGYPMDKGNVLDLAFIFHENYNVLLFDFRGMGENEGSFTTIGLKETKDFNAAVSFLKDKGMKKIGALGFSLGGAVIIMANNPDISAAVSDSSFARIDSMMDVVYGNFGVFRFPFVYCTKLIARFIFGIDTSKISPLDAIKDFKTPLFLIHSQKDSQIDVKYAHLLHKASPNSELWVMSSADHGETYHMYQSEYRNRVSAFFQKHMDAR